MASVAHKNEQHPTTKQWIDSLRQYDAIESKISALPGHIQKLIPRQKLRPQKQNINNSGKDRQTILKAVNSSQTKIKSTDTNEISTFSTVTEWTDDEVFLDESSCVSPNPQPGFSFSNVDLAEYMKLPASPDDTSASDTKSFSESSKTESLDPYPSSVESFSSFGSLNRFKVIRK